MSVILNELKFYFISLTKWFWNCISDVTSIMRNSVFSAALASNVSAISVPCGVEQWVFLTISCYCTDTTHCKWYGTYMCQYNLQFTVHNAWHFNPHNSISQLGIRVFQSHDVSWWLLCIAKIDLPKSSLQSLGPIG